MTDQTQPGAGEYCEACMEGEDVVPVHTCRDHCAHEWEARSTMGDPYESCDLCGAIRDLPVPAQPSAEDVAAPAAASITIRKPRILTGPKHQTVDQATASYLSEAAQRVRDNRYWGSGVTALVADLLDDVATTIAAGYTKPDPGAAALRERVEAEAWDRCVRAQENAGWLNQEAADAVRAANPYLRAALKDPR